jgi:transposase
MGESTRIENTFTKTCPECGHILRKEAGCHVCDNCAYTKCG